MWRDRRVLIGGLVVAVALVGGWYSATRPAGPSVPMAPVRVGEFVDVVEVRGQVRPRTSIILTAPMQAGELQILTIVKNGSPIKKGDVAVEFDGQVLQRTILDRQQELKQALAEMEQVKARARIGAGSNQMSLLTTKYDVERAQLDVNAAIPELTSKVDQQKADMALSDAKQREALAKVRDSADARATARGIEAQEKRIAKVRKDLERAEWAMGHLRVTSPANGVVNILPNWRNNTGTGTPIEYRPGDTTYAGAELVELPDMSQVRLEARLDETDRGRLESGQRVTIRVDAIPDREFAASVAEVAVLAKVDGSSWPPSKNFALKMGFESPDPRLRPGMSATARITVGRLPDMVMVPTEAVFVEGTRAVVYALRGGAFTAVPVEVVRRNKDMVALKGALTAADRVAMLRPDSVPAAGSAK